MNPSPKSPYANSKLMIENIMSDLYKKDKTRWKFISLRYFNPCGAHESGLIGEDPNGIPQNLMPYVSQVAGGKLPFLTVFGNDYPTQDGTAIRDYIHVMDLSKGHLAALKHLEIIEPSFSIFNLGSGKGTSVFEMISAFEKACGHQLPFKIGERRSGDVPFLVANPSKASEQLEWKTKYDINKMCIDLWKWQEMNPNGYKS